MKRFLISEEERKNILERHRSYGYKSEEPSENEIEFENMLSDVEPKGEKFIEEDDFDNLLDADEDLEIQRDSMEQMEEVTEDDEKDDKEMMGARSWSTFEASPKEKQIMDKLFGKYGGDIPPIVIRYLRKIPRKVLTKRLKDLKLIKLDEPTDD